MLLCVLAMPLAHASITFSITPEHCAYADGYIGTTVTGGVPPYTFMLGAMGR